VWKQGSLNDVDNDDIEQDIMLTGHLLSVYQLGDYVDSL